MTRVNASSEPSMEEILASIRKIIAEDPPGSRSIGQAKPAGGDGGFMSRDSYLKTSNTPGRDPLPSQSVSPRPTPAPPSRPAAQTQAPAAVAKEQSLPMPRRGETSEPLAPYGRANSGMLPEPGTEPDHEPMRPRLTPARDTGALKPEAKIERVAESSAQSIDAQLSDLLDDDAPPIANAAARPAPSSDARPGFTVSRVGFGTEAEPVNGDAEDPFDFDLGPSPFKLKAEPKLRGAATEDGSSLGRDTDAVIEAAKEVLKASLPETESAVSDSVAGYMKSGDRFDNQPAPTKLAPSFDTEVPAPVVQSQPRPAAPVYTPAEPIPTRAVYEPPSIEATIGPIRKLAPYPDILTPSPAAARRPDPPAEPAARPEPVSPLFSQPAAPARPYEASKPAEPETVMVERTEGALTPALFSMAMSEVDHRTMEDTVADLLRPMLKSWLAENMPRIIERALRREMLERTQPGRKSAAE